MNMDIDPARATWKIQAWNGDRAKPEALYVPYFDARDIEDKLDELFGWDGWSDELILSDGGKAGPFFISRITVHRKHDPAATAETGWRGGTVKSDAAPFTEREAVKGGASDAFKRAAAKLGVGRNAYGMPTFWAACELKGQGDKQRAVMPRGMEERLRKMALAAIKSNTVTAEPIEA